MKEQEICCRDDLRVEVIATVDVDDEGQPDFDICLTPKSVDIAGDPKPYWCVNCDATFVNFPDAVEHMNPQ